MHSFIYNSKRLAYLVATYASIVLLGAVTALCVVAGIFDVGAEHAERLIRLIIYACILVVVASVVGALLQGIERRIAKD